MKRTVSAAIGGRNFILDEDAYGAISNYLDSFREGLGNSGSKQEVMDELEMRIADLFSEKLAGKDVVDINIANSIISQLGMPDWKANNFNSAKNSNANYDTMANDYTPKRLYRDPDDKIIGGVCSGLALYLNIDVVLIRIIFLIALILGTCGFWIYIIFCIIAPSASTATMKCAMRGIPATAENIRRFSNSK